MKKQSKSATEIRNWEIKTKKWESLKEFNNPNEKQMKSNKPTEKKKRKKAKIKENQRPRWGNRIESTTQMKEENPGEPKIRTHILKRRVQCAWKLGFFREQRLGFWVLDLGFIREFEEECIQREELLERFGWYRFHLFKGNLKKKKKIKIKVQRHWSCSFELQTS